MNEKVLKAMCKVSSALMKQADWLDRASVLAIPGFTDRLAKLPVIDKAGKRISGTISPEHRASINDKLENSMAHSIQRRRAEEGLTPGKYMNPANVIGPGAAERRAYLADIEALANTRVGYSEQPYALDPNKPALTGSRRALVGSPQSEKFKLIRDRAARSLGPGRYMNPANVFSPNAKLLRRDIENDERLVNTRYSEHGGFSAIDPGKPYADDGWRKNYPIEL